MRFPSNKKVEKIFILYYHNVHSFQAALDMEAADLAQINQTDKEESEQDGKKEPQIRLRSLCENFQQQIQLALQWGAKVWPELYMLPGLIGLV